MSESQTAEKKSKYLINSIQRKALSNKVFPLLLIGSIIWLAGEYLFSIIFSDLELSGLNLIFYFMAVIIEAVIFVLFFIFSKSNKILLSIVLFFGFCFLAGILSIPVVIFTEFLPQVHMLVSLSVGANFVVYFLTLFLRDKYFSEGYLWAHIILYLIGCAIVEIIFLVFFNIQNYLLTIPVSLAYILIVSLILMFWGSRTVQKYDGTNWSFILFKILGVLFLALALAVVVVIIVLLIIVLLIICGDSNFDLSGLSFGGSGGTGGKKKKQQQL